ncbi:hypothetical protein BGZ70_003568, partial [Mortierella alpina]
MGVRGLPSLLNDAAVPKEDVHSFAGKRVHVDLMGTYFALIRALYFKLLREEAATLAKQSTLGTTFINVRETLRAVLHFGPQHDPRLRFIAEALHKKFERSGFDRTPNRTFFHLDGQRPYQKRREHAARAAKETTGLTKLDACFVQAPQAPQQPQQQQPPRLRKHSIQDIERKAKNLLHVPHAVLLTVCHFLEEKSWNVHHCAFEADPCIAQHCLAACQIGAPVPVYALSNDSDLFVYPYVRELIRPVWNKRNKFQHFNKQAVLRHLQLDDLQLLLVGIVTKNDYNQQFENYGVSTNLEIAKELRRNGMLPNNALLTGAIARVAAGPSAQTVLAAATAAMRTMVPAVTAYVHHVTVAGQAAPAAVPPGPAPVLNFTDAISVFAQLRQTAIPPGVVPAPAVDINERVLHRLIDLERVKISMRRVRTTHSHVHQDLTRTTGAAPPPVPAGAAPVVLVKSGVHNPPHVDRYDSVSPQAADPQAVNLNTQGGTGFQVRGPQRRQGGAAPGAAPGAAAGAAPAARVRRGSELIAPAAQAPAAPARQLSSSTRFKHAMDNVFQTSVLSVGSVKAKLRHVTGPAAPLGSGLGLTDAQRSLMADTINSAVTALNNLRSHMLQAIPLYISNKLATGPLGAAAHLAHRGRWLDPLLHKANMQMICYNLMSLLAGTSEMLPDHSTGAGPAHKRRKIEGSSTASPASPATSGDGHQSFAAAGDGLQAPAATGAHQSLAARIAQGFRSPPKDDRQTIAWEMFKLLVDNLKHDPVIKVPRPGEGSDSRYRSFVAEKNSREEMSKEVGELVRRHFIELFPILNAKATACGTGPEVGLDGANISTADLVWRFWSMNQRLPPLERIAFTPQAKLVDTFMFEEPRKPSARAIMQRMIGNAGDVVEMLFFGRQSPGNQPKAQPSSYDKRRVSINQLIAGPWPGMSAPPPAAAPAAGAPLAGAAPAPGALVITVAPAPGAPVAGAAPAPVPVPITNVFAVGNLRAHSSAVVAFRQSRTAARQANLPFTATAPALPHPTATVLPNGQPMPYYVPTGTVRTDGRELQVMAYDLRKPSLPPQKFHMPETEKIIKDIEQVFASQQDIVSEFGSYPANHVPVVGIDPGEVVSAAGCGINVNPTTTVNTNGTTTTTTNTATVTNLTVKRAALYAPIFRDRY